MTAHCKTINTWLEIVLTTCSWWKKWTSRSFGKQRCYIS